MIETTRAKIAQLFWPLSNVNLMKLKKKRNEFIVTSSDSRILKDIYNSEDLVMICCMGKERPDFYMNGVGHIYWGYKNSIPERLEKMPISLQIPFILKSVRNTELAERVKFIQDPLVFIELYIKAKFIFNADLEIGE